MFPCFEIPAKASEGGLRGWGGGGGGVDPSHKKILPGKTPTTLHNGIHIFSNFTVEAAGKQL